MSTVDVNSQIEARDRKRIDEVTDTDAKVIETCSVGDAWAQGDLLITYLGTSKPNHDMKKMDSLPEQLAPGTTKGSRHGFQAEKAKAFTLTNATPLEGPVLHCPQGLTVPHPEHGDVTLKEPGWYAITYQRAYAEELRRIAD
jgi:hypothetical protein